MHVDLFHQTVLECTRFWSCPMRPGSFPEGIWGGKRFSWRVASWTAGSESFLWCVSSKRQMSLFSPAIVIKQEVNDPWVGLHRSSAERVTRSREQGIVGHGVVQSRAHNREWRGALFMWAFWLAERWSHCKGTLLQGSLAPGIPFPVSMTTLGQWEGSPYNSNFVTYGILNVPEHSDVLRSLRKM